MPTIRSNEIDIYYEEHGAGEPLVLIMGWGGNAATWMPQIPGLAKHYRVIAFDNRGAGRTSAPDKPYSIDQMATDTVGLLDALGVRTAHVFGVSMGGMIAQELVLAHPERVSTLMLGCTSAGSSQAAGAEQLQQDITAFKETAKDHTPDAEWFSDFMKLLWTEEALARSDDHMQDFVLSLIRHPPTPHGMLRQAAAIADHSTYERLPQIHCPTLVITGTEDPLIAPRNSGILADRIPGAELRAFPGFKHAFHLELADLVNSLIVDFIRRAAALSEGRQSA